MRMNDDFIENNDLDWFASFSDNRLAHFTSGGTNSIPEKVKSSLEAYETVYDYFADLKGNCEFEIIEENLPRFDNDTKKNQYISSFIDATAKGLFSYNVNFNDDSYFLIAKPVTPLLLNDGSASSTTKSAVEEGTLIVRDSDKQTQNVNDLSRDTKNANDALGQIFDKQKEQDRIDALERGN